MSDDLSADDILVLRSVIAIEKDRQADVRRLQLDTFLETLQAADANLIDLTSQGAAGNGDAGLVAVATAIGAPLTGYNLTDWDILKGFIRDRLYAIRAQSFAGLP